MVVLDWERKQRDPNWVPTTPEEKKRHYAEQHQRFLRRRPEEFMAPEVKDLVFRAIRDHKCEHVWAGSAVPANDVPSEFCVLCLERRPRLKLVEEEPDEIPEAGGDCS